MTSNAGRAGVYVKVALGVALVTIALVFTAQNADTVTVRFLSWEWELSQSLLLFFVLLLGISAGALLTSWFRWRRARSHR